MRTEKRPLSPRQQLRLHRTFFWIFGFVSVFAMFGMLSAIILGSLNTVETICGIVLCIGLVWESKRELTLAAKVKKEHNLVKL